MPKKSFLVISVVLLALLVGCATKEVTSQEHIVFIESSMTGIGATGAIPQSYGIVCLGDENNILTFDEGGNFAQQKPFSNANDHPSINEYIDWLANYYRS